MVITVDLGTQPASVWLDHPQDFRAFVVSIRNAGQLPADSLPALVASFGRLEDDEHVFVDREALVGMAGRYGGDPGWLQGLAGMIAYATSKGWVDESGAIRAHIQA